MLTALGKQFGENLVLIPAIKQSNDQHKEWALLKLQRLLADLKGKTIAVLGLTYKPFTDTLRRSSSIELCRRLVEQACAVRAFDPAIKQLEMAGVLLCPSAAEALSGAEAAVLATPWPEFRSLDWAAVTRQMRRALVLDPHGFVKGQVRAVPKIEYHTVGSSA
jgi:UDPglucose 6-dehydrogenase